MLQSDELARIILSDGKCLELAVGEMAYGPASGTVYRSARKGQVTLERADRRKEILVYREQVSADVQFLFLGDPPVPENCYEARLIATFGVGEPNAFRLTLLSGRVRLSVNDFENDVTERLEPAFTRLVNEFAVTALNEATARQQGETRIKQELERLYRHAGLSLDQEGGVGLHYIRKAIARPQLELAKRRIEREAAMQCLAEEEAFNRFKARMEDAARKGDERARTVSVAINSVASVDKLSGSATPPGDHSALLDRQPEDDGRPEKPVYLAVLSRQEAPQYFKMARSYFQIGRHANCDLTLSSEAVSTLHAAVARLGSGLLFVDCQSTNGTWFCGQRITQRFLQSGDVLRMGDRWLVFRLGSGQAFQEIDVSLRESIPSSGGTTPTPPHAGHVDAWPPAETEEESVSAYVELISSSAGRIASSDSRPILIGHDSTCDLVLSGAVARFHAIVYWDVELDQRGHVVGGGIYVEDLHSGRGTILNGERVIQRKLRNSDVLELAGHRITISCHGNLARRAKTLYESSPAAGALALIGIEGPITGTRVPLNWDRICIGRKEHCDVVVPVPQLSGEHAEFFRSGQNYFVRDLGSKNGTFRNRHRLAVDEQKQLRRGDIIRLGEGRGHCDLLVCLSH